MRWFCERTMIQRGQKTHAFITAFGRSFYTPLYMYHLTYRHCLVLDWSFLSHFPYMSVIFLIYFLVSCLSILIYCFSYSILFLTVYYISYSILQFFLCHHHFSSVLTIIILFLNMNTICQIYRILLL